jgi:hypothetical protein
LAKPSTTDITGGVLLAAAAAMAGAHITAVQFSCCLLTSWISRRAAGVQQPAGARGQNCPQTHQKGWSFGFRAQGRGSLTYPLKTLKASLAPREHRGQFRNMLLAPNLSVLWSAVLHAHPLKMRVIQHWELVGVFVKLQPRLTSI